MFEPKYYFRVTYSYLTSYTYKKVWKAAVTIAQFCNKGYVSIMVFHVF